MSEFPSFSVSHWQGCAKAQLQAVHTADRKLCAAVTAYASYLHTGKLYGTLANADKRRIAAWVKDVCLIHSVDPINFALWSFALSGAEMVVDRVPGTVLGLTLDTYQWTAIKGLTCAGGVIGAFMGAGKTAMATAAAVGEIQFSRSQTLPEMPGRCWVFCPLNAMPTWEDARTRELSKYFAEVKIISIDSAHKYTAISEGDVMIVDEVHRAGTGSARRTKALHTIRSRFRFCVCLTGTMVHAGVEKCLSIKDLAVPGLAIFARNWTAGETFKCLVKKKIGPRTVTALEKPTTEREAFNQWLAIGVQLLSPDSKEVQSAFKLPGQELHEVTLNDPWPPLEEDVARVANAVFEETGEFPHAQAVAHYLARDGLDKKLDWLASELEGLEVGTQLVIFANYRDSLDGAEALLNLLGLSYVRVDGDVTGGDRSNAQMRFQNGDAAVFLGQIHAASESMNLQCANISITLDVSWSCIDYSQALARTHRRGQAAPCIHIDLVHNRLQARILDRLREGQDFAAECSSWQDIKRSLSTLALTQTPT